MQSDTILLSTDNIDTQQSFDREGTHKRMIKLPTFLLSLNPGSSLSLPFVFILSVGLRIYLFFGTKDYIVMKR